MARLDKHGRVVLFRQSRAMWNMQGSGRWGSNARPGRHCRVRKEGMAVTGWAVIQDRAGIAESGRQAIQLQVGAVMQGQAEIAESGWQTRQ
jgi:hypothetical protein